MSWEKELAIEGRHGWCLNCGTRPSEFPMRDQIAVGFGFAALTRDGQVVWSEDNRPYEKCLSGRQAENMAAKDPDHDWRITLDSPLSGREYQRHGPRKWMLIRQDTGFA